MYEKILKTLEYLRNKWDKQYLILSGHTYEYKDSSERNLAYYLCRKLSDKMRIVTEQIVAIDQELNGLWSMSTIRYSIYNQKGFDELISDIVKIMDELDTIIYYNKKQTYGN